MKRCLVDTGILYAAADRDDSRHERAARWLNSYAGRLLIASPIIAEVCCLLNTQLGRAAELRFVGALKLRELAIEHFADKDLSRIVELLEAYAALNLGFVDAANVAIAERLRITDIATTDRRRFSALRPAHCPAFTLLP